MRYSYPLFRFYNITLRIHIVYIVLILIAPLASYLFFNLLTALAIFQFLILLTLSILLHELGHVFIAKR